MKKTIQTTLLLLAIAFQQKLFAQHTWLKVAAGTEFTMALRSDSTIWSWGFNGNGQLGNGGTTGVYYPTQIGTDNDWVYITTGSIGGFAIKANGTLCAWGFNVVGQLGDGTTNQRVTPVQIGTAANWKTVESGQYHTLVENSVKLTTFFRCKLTTKSCG
jgi:alpha-tubulin suppressor-like RCC1 family protein